MNFYEKVLYRYIIKPYIYKIDIISVSAWVYIINFRCKWKNQDKSYFYVQIGSFKEIRSKFLKSVEINRELSFMKFLQEGNWLIPDEEIIRSKIFNWIEKT